MRYHSKLFYRAIGSESTVNETGDFETQVVNLALACYCRDESNSSGRKVTVGDGSHIEYSSLIYAPQDCPILKPGDIVEVQDMNGSVRISGTILRFSQDRYNCRIWL